MFDLVVVMLHVKMAQWIPGDVLFSETQRLERDGDRAEELVLLDSIVTPNGYLADNNETLH